MSLVLVEHSDNNLFHIFNCSFRLENVLSYFICICQSYTYPIAAYFLCGSTINRSNKYAIQIWS